MKFLKNTWYPAMWAKDLEPGSMVGRTIINEPVLFARKPDGSLAAMSDVCPHRYVPLSLGRMLENGRVQCVYHGLEFDSSGHCVRNPHGEGKIPTGLCTRTYAVQEKHTIIWIWMGEQTPDLTTIPDFSLMDDADDGMSRGRDSMVIEANYLLIADNLLDLSHANFLHDGILGLPEHSSAKITVDQTGNTVRTGRWMPDVPVARLHDLLFKRDGKKVDMWNDIRWDAPGCLILTHGFATPGCDRADAFEFRAVHLLTPETACRTHYAYGIVRTPTADEPEVQAEVAETRRFVFEQQDKVVLEAQQRRLGNRSFSDAKPVLLSVDAASVRMRRIVDKLIADEERLSITAGEKTAV